MGTLILSSFASFVDALNHLFEEIKKMQADALTPRYTVITVAAMCMMWLF